MATNDYRRRNSLRHPQHDYASAGAYFVTICAAQRECVFGAVANDSMQLSPLGQIAHTSWPELIQHHTDARLDEYVVMPNHVHALIWLHPLAAPEMRTAGEQRAFGHIVAGSLSALVRGYKSSVTQQAREQRLLARSQLWQRNFYDNIVRDDEALARIRDYIRRNPERWAEDQLHPAAPPNPFNRR